MFLVIENYKKNNDQQFTRHEFLIKFSLIILYIDFVFTMYILNVMCFKLNSLFDREMKVIMLHEC